MIKGDVIFAPAHHWWRHGIVKVVDKKYNVSPIMHKDNKIIKKVKNKYM